MASSNTSARAQARPLGSGVFLEQARKLFGHCPTKLLGIDNGYGTAIVTRDVVTDTDSDQLDWRARFDFLDDPAQMAVEIVARIDRERGIIDRRTVRDHHQDLALLGARQQTLVRPI